MSYAEVARLVERMTGHSLLSEQSIQRLVIDKAASVSEKWTQERVVAQKEEEEEETVASSSVLSVQEEEVDLYDAGSAEVLIMADAIQVKRQKAKRDRGYNNNNNQQHSVSKQKRATRVSTDVWLVERRGGGSSGVFEAITAGIDESGREVLSAEEQVRWYLQREYHGGEGPLPNYFVAIADGVRAIRCSLESIFGHCSVPPMILDWYHLEKKVREFMSMVAKNKQEKERHLEVLVGQLWRGQVDDCVGYLRTEIQEVRNEEKKQELVGYLEKHREEIIDYERRKGAGKTS